MEENTGPTKGPETSSKDAASLAVSQGPRPNATHLSFEDDNHLLKPKTASSQGAETLNRDTASPAMSQGPRPNATNLSFKDENHQLLKPEYSKNSGGRVRRKRSTLGSIRTQASSTGKRSLRGFFNDLDFSKGRDLDLSKGWDHFVANLPGTSKKNRKKVGGNRKKVDELTFKDPNSTPATTFPPPPTGLPLKSQQPATAFPPLHSETSFDVQQSATTSAPSPTGSPPDPQPPVRDTQPPPGDQLLQGEDQGGHHVETGLVDEEVEMLLNDDDGDGDEEKESLLAEDDDDGERDINDALWLSNLSRFFWSRLHVATDLYMEDREDECRELILEILPRGMVPIACRCELLQLLACVMPWQQQAQDCLAEAEELCQEMDKLAPDSQRVAKLRIKTSDIQATLEEYFEGLKASKKDEVDDLAQEVEEDLRVADGMEQDLRIGRLTTVSSGQLPTPEGTPVPEGGDDAEMHDA